MKTTQNWDDTRSVRLSALVEGEVYRASDPKIGRDVAIKVLPSDFSADKERVARFEPETDESAGMNIE